MNNEFEFINENFQDDVTLIMCRPCKCLWTFPQPPERFPTAWEYCPFCGGGDTFFAFFSEHLQPVTTT